MRSHPGDTLDRPISLEEFERLPEENEFRVELVRGRLVREPRPGAEHGWLAGQLVERIGSFARERELGIAVTETGFLLSVDPPTVRGPDVAFISGETIQEQGIPEGFWRIPPDLAVEVVSPSNTTTEIRAKVLEYMVAGTRLVWVVDPATRSVAAYRSRAEIRLLTDGDALDGADVLPGFRLGISDLFAPFRSKG